MKHGRSLVPVFGFGENFVYGQAPNPKGSKLRRFQMWCEKNLSFTVPIIYGRGRYADNYLLINDPLTT